MRWLLLFLHILFEEKPKKDEKCRCYITKKQRQEKVSIGTSNIAISNKAVWFCPIWSRSNGIFLGDVFFFKTSRWLYEVIKNTEWVDPNPIKEF